MTACSSDFVILGKNGRMRRGASVWLVKVPRFVDDIVGKMVITWRSPVRGRCWRRRSSIRRPSCRLRPAEASRSSPPPIAWRRNSTECWRRSWRRRWRRGSEEETDGELIDQRQRVRRAFLRRKRKSCPKGCRRRSDRWRDSRTRNWSRRQCTRGRWSLCRPGTGWCPDRSASAAPPARRWTGEKCPKRYVATQPDNRKSIFRNRFPKRASHSVLFLTFLGYFEKIQPRAMKMKMPANDRSRALSSAVSSTKKVITKAARMR